MKHFPCCFALFFFAVLYTNNVTAKETTHQTAYEVYDSLYNNFRSMRVDPSRSIVVHNEKIKRDAGELELVEGRLFFTTEVFGRVCAAVFIGKGNFHFTPPTDVEREQLKRMTGSASANEDFNHAVFVFADSTYSALSARCTPGGDDVVSDANRVLVESMHFLVLEDNEILKPLILVPMLEGIRTNAFWSYIKGLKSGEAFFSVDPREAEEVEYSRYKSTGATAYHDVELVCKFNSEDDLANGVDVAEHTSDLRIRHYDLDCRVNDRLHFSGKAKMYCRPRFQNRHWVHIKMASNLIIDSIVYKNQHLEWKSTGSKRWIYLPQVTDTSVELTLEFYYNGDVFLRQRDFIYMKFGSSAWYPQTDEIQRSTFDLLFHTSTDYKFQSAGVFVSSETKDGYNHGHWKIDKPQIHTSFAIGVFEEKVIRDSRVPPVKLWYERDSKHEDDVAQDLLYSLIFYQDLFGKPPFENMTAAEINAFHGQAFPGFLHLSWVTFVSGDNSGGQESFVAHEVAHQWWGGSLAWSNYHDQWMSEAFSEYSSLMYMQSVLKDNKKFFAKLDEYKRKIIDNRKSIFGKGTEAGPIWLGYRTSSSHMQRGDYDLIIYRKGAWVLHMLRTMMIDMSTLSDAGFIGMMKDYYATFRDQDPTTADFQAKVEQHVGQDMDWFFKQWVYGTKIPKYIVSYKTQQNTDGTFKVTMHVEQQNVPPEFQMIIPIHVDIGEKGRVPLRVLIKGAVSEFDLPPFGTRPEKIDFNVFNSVLCEWEISETK